MADPLHQTTLNWHPLATAPQHEMIVMRGPRYRNTICRLPCERCQERATEWRWLVEKIDV